MKSRFPRVCLALGLTLSLQMPALAQVRPILLPSLSAIPGASAGAALSGASLLSAAPALAMAPALSPAFAPSLSAPALAAAPAAAAASIAAAPAAAASALAPAAAPASAAPRAAAVSLSGLKSAAVPAGAPALAGFDEGRRAFDGAALEGPARDQAGAPAPAPRGDAVQFNGQTLPSRMFSDQTQISSHLIRAIDATKKTLDIAIYELAIREVRDALVRAKGRGVKVRIVMDQSHLYPEKSTAHRTPEVQSLVDAGFELKTLRGGDAYGIMHNKFAVFDGALLETGSYNWTRAADTQHYENALFDDDATRIASYQSYWNWMWSSARVVDDKNPPARIVLDEHGHSAPLPPAPQDSARSLSFNGVSLPRESYTPHGTSANIVAAIDAARETVVVANFSFTHADLIESLKRAKDRGLKIRVVFDRYQYGFLKEMAEMVDLGFDVRLSNGKDGQKGVMHNKFVVLDGKLVETGSFNWTFNGELNNYENAAFLDAPDDAAAWAAYFERIWNQGRAPTAADHQDRQRHDAGDGLVRPDFVPHNFIQPRSFVQPRGLQGPAAGPLRTGARPGPKLSGKAGRSSKRLKKLSRRGKHRRGR
jgi:phosphatidylserine/phosphatidylglycerophosphate/cardiolipin synthase-like enzyme